MLVGINNAFGRAEQQQSQTGTAAYLNYTVCFYFFGPEEEQGQGQGKRLIKGKESLKLYFYIIYIAPDSFSRAERNCK